MLADSEAVEFHDRELVAAYLSRRDEPTFLALYRRHTPALLGLAARLSGGNGSEAEELVQEAWVRAGGSLGTFRFQSALRTWLSGFVVNVWRERRRLLDRPGPVEDAGGPANTTPALPAGFRAVLVLHDVEGYTHGEIAAQLGIEAGTSKSQLARARRALRERLSAVTAAAAGGGS